MTYVDILHDSCILSDPGEIVTRGGDVEAQHLFCFKPRVGSGAALHPWGLSQQSVHAS